MMLHRIEALAGQGRFTVTFRRPDGGEQATVVQVGDGAVEAAEAGLPAGWTLDSDAFRTLADAVLAVHRARQCGPAAPALADVDGGWDVMMGNVVLTGDRPTCTAHGAMSAAGAGLYRCDECGARACYPA